MACPSIRVNGKAADLLALESQLDFLEVLFAFGHTMVLLQRSFPPR